jgi:uncharacterized protein (DUF302 family)
MAEQTTVMLGARVEPSFARKVEKLREKLEKKNGMKVTTSNVVRSALQQLMEKEAVR